jgi:hypothetical protein
LKKDKFIGFLIGIAVSTIIICLIMCPYWLQNKEKTNYITYDNWLLFFGSVGSAVLGGTITGVGLYVSFKGNRNILIIQMINEEIQYLREYTSIIEDLSSVLYDISKCTNETSINGSKFKKLFDELIINSKKIRNIQSCILDDELYDYLVKANNVLVEVCDELKNKEFIKDEIERTRYFGQRCNKSSKEYCYLNKKVGQKISSLNLYKKKKFYK